MSEGPVCFVPQRNPLTHKICLGESSVIEDGFDRDGSAVEWAGGGGGGGGATFIFRVNFFFFLFLSSPLLMYTSPWPGDTA